MRLPGRRFRAVEVYATSSLNEPRAPTVLLRRDLALLRGCPNEVYALVAFLFHWNGIIKENDGMDEKTPPKVVMPNRNGFVPAVPGRLPSVRSSSRLRR